MIDLSIGRFLVFPFVVVVVVFADNKIRVAWCTSIYIKERTNIYIKERTSIFIKERTSIFIKKRCLLISLGV